MHLPPHVEGLLRELAPRALAALTRRYGHFDLAEDAVQEALLAAATSWPDAMPDDPAAWLIAVGSRRLTDLLRSDQARRRREHSDAQLELPLAEASGPFADADDSLLLLLLCCHPALSPPAQVALTLRAVGGLTTAEIARELLLPEATVTRRITRAKQAIRDAGGRFALPPPDEWTRRLDVVLHVIYLMFTEGHTASAGDDLVRADLCDEAIRLGRMLRRQLPDEPEVAGLLAQMLLIDSRRRARTTPDGDLVPLAVQDRSLWNMNAAAEGIELVTEALARRRPGPYQLQAAVNAVHAEAPTFADTDWPQILALYGVLDQLADDPVVTLNRAVALAQVEGAAAALVVVETAAEHPRLAGHHRVYAVRAHLLAELGRHPEAAAEYRAAARRTLSEPERRYLLRRAASADRRHGDPSSRSLHARRRERGTSVLMSSVVSHVAAYPGSIAQIRPLSPRDAVDLAEAYWRSYRDESAGFTLAHGTQDVARILSGAHGQLAADASLIAMIEDRGVGAVVTVIDPPYPATPAGPYIVDLYVVPTERRRGVGTALLRTALAALQGQNVHLRVEADNEPAIRLYTAHGFTPVAFARPDSSG